VGKAIQSKPVQSKIGKHANPTRSFSKATNNKMTTPQLRETINTHMQLSRWPGLAIAVVKRHQLHWAQGFGLANIETQQPVTPETTFEVIASISKTVAATAILQLRDQGKLELDQPINQVLPFAVRHPHFPKTAITIRHLLTHTSSIDCGALFEASYRLADQEDSYMTSWLKSCLTPNGINYIPEANFRPYEPGKGHCYSNTNTGLLGVIVEQLTKKPYRHYVRDAILRPLGMKHSGFFLSDIDRSNMARAYAFMQKGKSFGTPFLLETPEASLSGFVPYKHYTFPPYPCGGLRSSANDLAHFAQLWLSGGRTNERQLLSNHSIQEALTPQVDASLLKNDLVQQGLAWLIEDKTFSYWGHTGGCPGIASILSLDPTKGSALVLLANGGWGQVGKKAGIFPLATLLWRHFKL
jgi:CubicO group peptidase (beta-lactamase class C family)